MEECSGAAECWKGMRAACKGIDGSLGGFVLMWERDVLDIRYLKDRILVVEGHPTSSC